MGNDTMDIELIEDRIGVLEEKLRGKEKSGRFGRQTLLKLAVKMTTS